MNTQTRTAPRAENRLADATRLGAVHLTVTDLDRSVAFYQDAIGLRLHQREDPAAAMGAGGDDLARPRRGAGRPSRRPPRRPLPLRPADAEPRGARPRAPAPRRDAHADRGRLRPRHLRGDLPSRPRRQRHRARRRPPARGRGRRCETLGRPDPLDLDGLLGTLGDAEPVRARRPRHDRRPRPPARERHRRRAPLLRGRRRLRADDRHGERGLRVRRAATTTTSASTPGAASASRAPRRRRASPGCGTGRSSLAAPTTSPPRAPGSRPRASGSPTATAACSSTTRPGSRCCSRSTRGERPRGRDAGRPARRRAGRSTRATGARGRDPRRAVGVRPAVDRHVPAGPALARRDPRRAGVGRPAHAHRVPGRARARPGRRGPAQRPLRPPDARC